MRSYICRIEGGTDLDDVEHHGKLAEKEDLMATSEQFIEEAFQHHHLSTSMDKVFIDDGLPGVFVHRPVEKERMGADFSELHDSVLQLHVIDLLDWNETIPLAEFRAGGYQAYPSLAVDACGQVPQDLPLSFPLSSRPVALILRV